MELTGREKVVDVLLLNHLKISISIPICRGKNFVLGVVRTYVGKLHNKDDDDNGDGSGGGGGDDISRYQS